MNKYSATAAEMPAEIGHLHVCSWIARAMPSETQQLFTWYSVAAVVNIILAITTSFGNVLILFALQKEYTLSTPSRVLFRSLAASDVCVGLISQPIFAISMLRVSNGDWDICRLMAHLTVISSTALCGVSLLTMTAISVDRLLVLLLESKYSRIVTCARVKVVVVLFWISSLALSMIYLINLRTFFLVTCVMIILSIIISAYSYCSIFIILRRRQRRIHDQSQGGQIINSVRLRRELRHRSTVYSALWIHFALAICYLPFSSAVAISTVDGRSLSVFIAGACTGTLIHFNSLINPFLYYWKIKEVRQAVKQIVRSC